MSAHEGASSLLYGRRPRPAAPYTSDRETHARLSMSGPCGWRPSGASQDAVESLLAPAPCSEQLHGGTARTGDSSGGEPAATEETALHLSRGKLECHLSLILTPLGSQSMMVAMRGEGGAFANDPYRICQQSFRTMLAQHRYRVPRSGSARRRSTRWRMRSRTVPLPTASNAR
jgi:hypothetical protein